MFVGREKEIKEIREALDRDGKSAVLIYGKRRIGKSTLIQEVLSRYSCPKIYYECLNSTFEENLRNFEKRIRMEFQNPYLHFDRFQDAFEYLGSLNQRVIVVLDEYSYLKGSCEKGYVDSVFQNIIDNMDDNIRMILLGSYVSVMRELLEEEDPLFGRFSLILHLQSFDYYTSSFFYPDRTVREKIALYSVFGGSPFVNAMIDPDKDLHENILRLILNPNSSVRSYLENILLSELQKTGPANTILSSLANGKKKYSEIENITGIRTAGVLDKQLKNLMRMDVIDRKSPINRANDRRKIFYEISDNLVRFYYAYVFSQRDIIMRIGADNFYHLYIEPTLDSYVSYRFEEIVREYFRKEAQAGRMKEVYDIGTYWYDDPVRHSNGEFDCVLKHKDGYSFYEAKYFKKPMSPDMCRKEKEEICKVSGELHIEKVGFVCSAGFDFLSDEYDLISGEELYRKKEDQL